MRCEIIAVGTELLLGQTVDTNSTWMGEQLASAGINSHFQTKVGDNLDRMVSALRIALDRSDAIIMCGGLGPTQDDITREAIAIVMDVGLVRDESIVERIRTLFKTRGRDMPLNNLRQADVPKGASVIPQMPGTAPGLICPVDGKVIYAVPGVPHEMQAMLQGTVVPDLRRRSGEVAAIRSRILRTWGQSESALAEMLAGRIKELDHRANPTLAFLASGIEGLKVRITAKAPDEKKAERILADEEVRLRAIMGDIIFGVDTESMESTVIDLLRRQNRTLAVAESLTGGLVGARLTAIPGASDVFRGAVVSYASDIKYQMLDVPEGPVVNAATAKAMALGVCNVLGSDVGLATTGVAGPSMQENQPVGTVFLGLAINGRVEAHHARLPGDRDRIRQFSVINLLNLLRLRLLAQELEVRESTQ